MIPNPQADQRNQPTQIPNRGLPLGFVLEKRLRQFRFYCWHMHRIQRPFEAASASLERLSQVWELRVEKDEEDEGEQVKDPEKLTKVDEVRKTLENLDYVLLHRKGRYGVALAYIVRDTVDLPDDAEDPGWGQPSFKAELIRRTRHNGHMYQSDNEAVWAIIRKITHGGPG